MDNISPLIRTCELNQPLKETELSNKIQYNPKLNSEYEKYSYIEPALRTWGGLLEGFEKLQKKVYEKFRETYEVFSFTSEKAEPLKEGSLLNSTLTEEEILFLKEDFLSKYEGADREFLNDVFIECTESCLEGRSPYIALLENSRRNGDLEAFYRQVHLLFHFLDYMRMQEFQKAHFEPFNLKFKEIDLDCAPHTIKQLQLNSKDVEGIDFSRFTKLEKLNLEFTKNLTPTQIRQIPSRIKYLTLTGADVAGVDFSRFTELEMIGLSLAINLTKTQIGQISTKIKHLDLTRSDIAGFDFSRFVELEELDLSHARNAMPAQIMQIYKRIKILHLEWADLERVDFSRFTELEKLNLGLAINLTPTQIKQISVNIKHLILAHALPKIAEFDFSRFVKLEEMDLSYTGHLTPAQIMQIPEKVKILKLNTANVAEVDFSRFTDLEEIDLRDARNLTKEQIEQISCPKILR